MWESVAPQIRVLRRQVDGNSKHSQIQQILYVGLGQLKLQPGGIVVRHNPYSRCVNKSI